MLAGPERSPLIRHRAMVELALVALADNDLAGARTTLRELLEEDPGDATAAALLATLDEAGPVATGHGLDASAVLETADLCLEVLQPLWDRMDAWKPGQDKRAEVARFLAAVLVRFLPLVGSPSEAVGAWERFVQAHGRQALGLEAAPPALGRPGHGGGGGELGGLRRGDRLGDRVPAPPAGAAHRQPEGERRLGPRPDGMRPGPRRRRAGTGGAPRPPRDRHGPAASCRDLLVGRGPGRRPSRLPEPPDTVWSRAGELIGAADQLATVVEQLTSIAEQARQEAGGPQEPYVHGAIIHAVVQHVVLPFLLVGGLTRPELETYAVLHDARLRPWLDDTGDPPDVRGWAVPFAELELARVQQIFDESSDLLSSATEMEKLVPETHLANRYALAVVRLAERACAVDGNLDDAERAALEGLRQHHAEGLAAAGIEPWAALTVPAEADLPPARSFLPMADGFVAGIRPLLAPLPRLAPWTSTRSATAWPSRWPWRCSRRPPGRSTRRSPSCSTAGWPR